jgi:hypothetical protein
MAGMIHYLEKIAKDLVKENLQRYWTDFELVAYAIFDKNSVYLFNHPKHQDVNPHSYKVLSWNEQFVGNTIILYEGYPTAIADIELYNDYEGLYSILVHELFHGYQYIKGEKRFPDEIMGITYPITVENAELRNRERRNLYDALMETDISKKRVFLKEFIELRDKRSEGIKDHLTYENLIESVEGPAWYVELKAYSEKSCLAHELVLKKYGANLLDIFESNSNIRRSSYSSGLFMCLLLDEFLPNWKESFFSRDSTLFDLIKQLNVETSPHTIVDVEISPETAKSVNYAIELRKKEFEEFENQTGTQLFIEGEITAFYFDPMNIVPVDGKLLHKNFIKVRINNNEYFIQQPTIAYCVDGLKKINKLHLFLKDTPIENGDSLTVPGVGEINGRYTRQEDTYYLISN